MRHKEFNRNKVLEDSISLFWSNGITACSIKDLVAETHVNRFSLYKEFDNKEGILLNALDLYYDRYSSKQIDLLRQNKPTKEVLKEFYTSFLTTDSKHPPGCFMIHTSSELADHNKDVKMRLDTYIKEIEQEIGKLLERDPETEENSHSNAIRLTGLFCSSMCFCLIQNPEERLNYLDTSIDLILH